MVYARPRSVDEAVYLLAAKHSLVVCGGTDVFPALAGRQAPDRIVDLSAIESLRRIDEVEKEYRFGAAVTWSMIAEAALPRAFDGLRAAAREVGSIQIQNRGTIAGNLCNASPAADGIPPLLTLDAGVELTSAHGIRRMPLSSFITGYRQTALRPDEIVTAVTVPRPRPGTVSSFVKLGARRYLVISILMAAVVIEHDEHGQIAGAAIAVGAASPVATRLPDLEARLVGLPANIRPSSIVTVDHMKHLAPIDDVRATATYRREAAVTLVGEALDRAIGGPWLG
jgi:CO/xanthine dehydrogenase FAD-binding subunit